HVIRDEAELRSILGMPSDLVRAKVRDRLDQPTRQCAERARSVFLATAAPDGSCDVSPRGDPPGFVRVLDERTLLLPERPGNRLPRPPPDDLSHPPPRPPFLPPPPPPP